MISGVLIATFSSNIYHLYFGLGLLVGCGSCFVYCVSMLAVCSYFVRRRGLATSVCAAGCALGSMLYPPLIEYSLQQRGFRYTMLMELILLLAAFLCALVFEPAERYYRWVPYSNLPAETANSDCLRAGCSVKDPRTPNLQLIHSCPDDAPGTAAMSKTRTVLGSTPMVTSTSERPPAPVVSLVPEVLPVTPTLPSDEYMCLSRIPPQLCRHPAAHSAAGKSRLHLSTASEASVASSSGSAESAADCDECDGPVADPLSVDYCEVCQAGSATCTGLTGSVVPPSEGPGSSVPVSEDPGVNLPLVSAYPLCPDLAPSLLSFSGQREPMPTGQQSAEQGISTSAFIDLSLFTNRTFLVFAVSGALFQVSAVNLLLLLPSVSSELGADAAISLSLFSGSDLVGRLVAATLSDHAGVPRHVFLLASYLLTAGATAALCVLSLRAPLMPRAWAAGTGAAGLGVGAVSALSSLVLIERLGIRLLASAFGLSVCVSGLALLASPPLLGGVRQLGSSPGPVIGLLAFLSLLAAVCWSLISNRPRQTTPQAADSESES